MIKILFYNHHTGGIMLGCRIRQALSWLLLLGTLILGIAFGLGVFNAPSAHAVIWQLEEAPDQVLYQTRQGVKDQFGDSWQIIAFKRQYPDGQERLQLRLVGFPIDSKLKAARKIFRLDPTQPLDFINVFGQTLTAAVSDEVPSEVNVGQYNLRSVLSELAPEIPWTMMVSTLTPEGISGEAIKLHLFPLWLQEWHRLDQVSE
jgi:hypothetical protein